MGLCVVQSYATLWPRACSFVQTSRTTSFFSNFPATYTFMIVAPPRHSLRLPHFRLVTVFLELDETMVFEHGRPFLDTKLVHAEVLCCVADGDRTFIHHQNEELVEK